MFGKLMKNEFRNIGRLLLLINAIVLGMHVLVSIFEQIYNSGILNGTVFERIFAVFAGLYFVSIFAVNIIIVLVFAARFYRKVYSTEGYLTHTLPVNKTAIYFAMLISSGIGTIITAIVSFGYVFIRVTNELIIPGGFTLKDLFRIAGMYNITGLTYFLIILGMVVTVFASFAIVFLCVSIGQNWKAHPVIGSIIAYWVLTTVMQIFSAIGIVFLASSNIADNIFENYKLPGDFINAFAGYMIGINIILIAVMSIVSIVIMKKRLNL